MPSIEISKRLQSIPVSATRKLTPYMAAPRAKGIKIHHLNIGDSDIPTPDCLIEGLKNWSMSPIPYAPSDGIPAFIEAMKTYYHRLGYDFLKNENILATIGGSEAMAMTIFAITEPDDEILIPEPFYSNYGVYGYIFGAKIVPIPTRLKDGFHLPTLEDIEARITPRTKAILFCSPNNPTGTVYTEEEIKRLVEIAKKHNLFLISDEVYREYVFEEKKHTSLFSFMNEIPDQAIVIDSLSKRYSLCGARLGVLSSLNGELIKGITRMAYSRLSGGMIDQTMASTLNEVPASYIQMIQTEYQKRRNILLEGLSNIPGVQAYKPEGAFYIMAGLPVKSSDEFCIWLLSEYHLDQETVMLAPGAGFYQTPRMGLSEVRIAYVLKEKELRRAVEILGEGLRKYKG